MSVYVLGTRPLRLDNTTTSAADASLPVARFAVALQPSVVLVGRGILDLLLYDTPPAAVADEVVAVFSTLRAALQKGQGLEEVRDDIKYMFMLPRPVLECPMHVECAKATRQDAFRRILKRELGERLRSSFPQRVTIVPSVATVWPAAWYDWRGVGFILQRHFDSFAATAIKSVTTSLKTQRRPRTDTSEISVVDATPPEEEWTLGGRRCNCMQYHPDWCLDDERRRTVPTSIWNRRDELPRMVNEVLDSTDVLQDIRAKRTTRTAVTKPLHCPSSRVNGTHAIKTNTSCATGVEVESKAIPCGPIPPALDMDHVWIIRQLGTRWPLKPQYTQFTCASYVPVAAELDSHVHALGPPQCLIFFGRKELDVTLAPDNFPDIDLEECFSARRIKPLIIGSSHQQFGLPYHSLLVEAKKRHSLSPGRMLPSYKGVDWSVRDDNWIVFTFEGAPVLDFRWDHFAAHHVVVMDHARTRRRTPLKDFEEFLPRCGWHRGAWLHVARLATVGGGGGRPASRGVRHVPERHPRR